MVDDTPCLPAGHQPRNSPHVFDLESLTHTLPVSVHAVGGWAGAREPNDESATESRGQPSRQEKDPWAAAAQKPGLSMHIDLPVTLRHYSLQLELFCAEVLPLLHATHVVLLAK